MKKSTKLLLVAFITAALLASIRWVTHTAIDAEAEWHRQAT